MQNIGKKESHQIIGKGMEVHNLPGAGLLENVYKDALEYECQRAQISFEREKEYLVHYKGSIVPHKLLC